jgi:hypothetical protein
VQALQIDQREFDKVLAKIYIGLCENSSLQKNKVVERRAINSKYDRYVVTIHTKRRS